MYPEAEDNDEGEEKPKKQYPLAPARMSKLPSWISVSVLVGVIIGWNTKPSPKPTTVELKLPEPPVVLIPTPTKLTTIEAVFEAWGHLAVWDRDATEVAYWNDGTQAFTEFYEIRRAGTVLYFRSIPKLTRLEIRHGKEPPPECPLRFTETEAQYKEWQESRVERPRSSIVQPPPSTLPVAPAMPRAELAPVTLPAPSVDLRQPEPGK